MLKERIEGWYKVAILNFVLFAPYFNAKVYPAFSLDKIIVLLCITFIASMLLSRVIYCVVAVTLVVVNIICLHIAFHWGLLAFNERINIGLESPPLEMFEYLKTYCSTIDVFIIIHAVLCLWGIWHIARNRKPSTYWMRALSAIPFVLILLPITANPRALSLPIISLPYEIYDQPVRHQRLERRNALISSMPERNLNCRADFKNIVIVIGESASADHNPLYGYTHAGKSGLSGEGFTTFNAISGANQTRLSIPMMLTSASVDNFDDFYKSESILTELKSCGYATYWISNQPQSGRWEDNVSSLGKEADISVYLTANAAADGNHFDEELVEQVNLLNNGDEKKAFIVHLAGSHFDYHRRYPKSFASQEGPMIDIYNSTVRYTDTVLTSLFKSFDKGSLLFVYASDHGEVFDHEIFGHGFIPSYQDEYRVPLIAWSSNQGQLKKLQDYAKGKVINTESFNDILDYLIGLESTPAKVSFSNVVLQASSSHLVSYSELRDAKNL
ncbi:MAG: integral rane protein [Verrucomicrobiaceae bacterium]|nr:integral rane protein [Verrucomicrobiaceae bacterium]